MDDTYRILAHGRTVSNDTCGLCEDRKKSM